MELGIWYQEDIDSSLGATCSLLLGDLKHGRILKLSSQPPFRHFGGLKPTERPKTFAPDLFTFLGAA